MPNNKKGSSRFWRHRDEATSTIPENGYPSMEDDRASFAGLVDETDTPPGLLGSIKKKVKGRFNEGSRQLSRFSLTSQESSFSQLERAAEAASTPYRAPPPETDCCACLGINWDNDQEITGALAEGVLSEAPPPPPKMEHSITDRVRDQVIIGGGSGRGAGGKRKAIPE
ncbi:hypothetical protein FOL47_007626 [Perkinsus chesapeaki]|uniref:Uncharacterized protein n=1 Tax=Perkinsus chesapeaki TaxID=330153 RepID=A0A7J6LJI7_PERCH|nr:hypothetical protein FOL47_007626 [Perkinsus chesapeaki]